jgi:hypothetical protein
MLHTRIRLHFALTEKNWRSLGTLKKLSEIGEHWIEKYLQVNQSLKG